LSETSTTAKIEAKTLTTNRKMKRKKNEKINETNPKRIFLIKNKKC
jgi:hypothetical protein